MNIFRFLSVLPILLINQLGTASELPTVGRVQPYLFCNVFLADGCFGIAAGDKLTMQVITDFVQYDLVFSSGGSARLYSGYNPKIMDEDKKLENCSWRSKFSECISVCSLAWSWDGVVQGEIGTFDLAPGNNYGVRIQLKPEASQPTSEHGQT